MRLWLVRFLARVFCARKTPICCSALPNTSTIWTSANLTQIFVLTGGGPNYATTTLPLYAYLTAIPGHRLGAGAAISMMIVPFYMILVYFLTRRMLQQEA